MIHPRGQKQPPRGGAKAAGGGGGKGGHENPVTQLGFILLAYTTQEEKLLR